MKKLFFLLATIFFFAFSASAQKVNKNSTKVKGYTKKNGTYVKPHNRTKPNSTQKDNYTSKPNTNPYTGKKGTKKPKYAP